ncbi:MAG: hypothetical protein R3C51_12770 [Parvularculaceae bacterium]
MAYGENDGATIGYLIGEEGKGLNYMFMMMNNARLSVGLEGVAIAERAYQESRKFRPRECKPRASPEKALTRWRSSATPMCAVC